MHAAITQFRRNHQAVEDLGKLYSLIRQSHPLLALQAEEILRAQIALTVSALDNFIHDCVRLGMIEVFLGQRKRSKPYESFALNIVYAEGLVRSVTSQDQIQVLEDAIRIINAKDSFHSVRGIEYAMSLISFEKVWSRLAKQLQMTTENFKQELNLIVNRRNKIVHEADFNFSTGSKYPIDKPLVDNTVRFVSNMCETLHSLL